MNTMDSEAFKKWHARNTLLSSVGVKLPYSRECQEGDSVIADFKGISLRFQYTDEGTDQCLYVMLKAEKLHREFFRSFFYKLFHRCPRQTSFEIDNPKEYEKAVRAVLDRM
jgi:hypothetical protein